MVADIDSLLRQHDEIVALFDELAGHDDEQDIMDNAMGLSLTLSQLAGKMYFHILAEERILYPALLSQQSESVRENCRKYSAEMDKIARWFRRYRAAYSSAGKILAHPITFRNCTASVGGIIRRRFEDEKLVLYGCLNDFSDGRYL
jgi:hypothetical protein